MPVIRPLRPMDLLAVGAFLTRGSGDELTAETWPRTPPESRHPTLTGLTLGALFPSRNTHTVGQARGPNGPLTGLIVASGRADGMVWDVEHLRAADTATGVELLRWTGERAIEATARRVFIDTPDGASGSEVASRAGFERHSEGTSYRLNPGVPRHSADTGAAGPRLRS